MGKAIKQAPLGAKLGLALLAVLLVLVVVSPLATPYDPVQNDLLHGNQPPVFFGGSMAHPFGTDQLGRDVLSRCMFGLSVSAGIALIGVFIGGVLGISLGVISGYFGKQADRIIMALVDFQLAVPYTLIVLMGLVMFGRSIPVLIVFIGFSGWESYAKLTRGVVLSIRRNNYIDAAICYNAPARRIICRHVLPNVLPTLLVIATLNFPSIIMLESSLSFLGIGVQPPTASLGRMVGEGRNVLMSSWWVSVMPALVILILSVTVQRVGDWLRDVSDVHMDRSV